MQLVIEAECTTSSRRAMISPGQFLVAGRGMQAGMCVDEDRNLHEEHLAFVGVGSEFRVLASQTAGQIVVNGHPVSEAPLSNGDRIFAGSTLFRVTIRGRLGVPCEKPQRSPRWSIQERRCASGLFATTCRDISLPDLIRGVLPEPCHLIFDRQLHRGTAGLRGAQPLLPGTPENFGSVLLSPSRTADTIRLIELYWNSGTVIGVLSSLTRIRLLSKMRNLPASFSDAGLLSSQLESGPPVFASFLVSELLGILMATPAAPDWTLYSTGSVKSLLISGLETPTTVRRPAALSAGRQN